MNHEGFLLYGILLLVSLALSRSYKIQRQELYLRLLDKKLEALLKVQGVEWSSLSLDVQRLAIDPGTKIAAIKLYREENPGVSISQAKAEIENFVLKK